MTTLSPYISSFDSIEELFTYTIGKYGNNGNLYYQGQRDVSKYTTGNCYTTLSIRIDKEKLIPMEDRNHFLYIMVNPIFKENDKGILLGALNMKRSESIGYIEQINIGDGFICITFTSNNFTNFELSIVIDTIYDTRTNAFMDLFFLSFHPDKNNKSDDRFDDYDPMSP